MFRCPECDSGIFAVPERDERVELAVQWLLFAKGDQPYAEPSIPVNGLSPYFPAVDAIVAYPSA